MSAEERFRDGRSRTGETLRLIAIDGGPLAPVLKRSRLLELLARWGPIGDEFPEVDERPTPRQRRDLEIDYYGMAYEVLRHALELALTELGAINDGIIP